MRHITPALAGVILVILAMALLLGAGVLYLAGLAGLGFLHPAFVAALAGGMVLLPLGLAYALADFFYFLPRRAAPKAVPYEPLADDTVTVALTAYNDEESIGQSVRDFLDHPKVKRVIVVSNNSKDRTMEVAAEAGAQVFNETVQGYGACSHRALSESLNCMDTDLTILCEGDMTFRAHDIDKFLAYAPHTDIAIGTRTNHPLQDSDTQVTTFIHYGNYFVAKLIELKHLGKVTLSDVGTTYKLCRNRALKELLPLLNPHLNLEFNPYFLDLALQHGFKVVECPITFYRRVGVSKGGNVSNYVAFKLGMRMIWGILSNWRSQDGQFTDRHDRWA